MISKRIEKRIEEMLGGRKDAGFTTMEIIIGLLMIALAAAVGIALYFIFIANNAENNAQAAGMGAHNAFQAYYADYGSKPDADDIDAYLESVGDVGIDEFKADTVSITIYEHPTVTAPNATLTIVEDGTEFTDVIVIERTGQVQKYPEGDGPDASGYTALAEW